MRTVYLNSKSKGLFCVKGGFIFETKNTSDLKYNINIYYSCITRYKFML